MEVLEVRLGLRPKSGANAQKRLVGNKKRSGAKGLAVLDNRPAGAGTGGDGKTNMRMTAPQERSANDPASGVRNGVCGAPEILIFMVPESLIFHIFWVGF